MKKFDRAAEAYKKSGFVKTSEKPREESGYSKAAKFLLLVGPDQAAEVLKQFSQDEVEKIVREISQVRKLDGRESASILEEFGNAEAANSVRRTNAAEENRAGGPDRAREMLIAAFGKEKGGEVFRKVLPFGGRKPFDFLNELQPEQILMVLKNEPPYVLSIVLSFLEPEISSTIIEKLPTESRKEIVLRIARQGDVAPGIIEKMEGIFRDRIRAQGRIVTDEIDGKSVLAGILKHMSPSAEDTILEVIKNEDQNLADEIRDSIYTIDLLMNMDGKDIQFLLRDFADSELAVVIKGKSKEIRDCILDNVSDRRRVMIEEESLYLGEMRRSDVDKSTRELVDYLIELEEKGEIMIPRGEEEWI